MKNQGSLDGQKKFKLLFRDFWVLGSGSGLIGFGSKFRAKPRYFRVRSSDGDPIRDKNNILETSQKKVKKYAQRIPGTVKFWFRVRCESSRALIFSRNSRNAEFGQGPWLGEETPLKNQRGSSSRKQSSSRCIRHKESDSLCQRDSSWHRESDSL